MKPRGTAVIDIKYNSLFLKYWYARNKILFSGRGLGTVDLLTVLLMAGKKKNRDTSNISASFKINSKHTEMLQICSNRAKYVDQVPGFLINTYMLSDTLVKMPQL